MKIVRKIKNDLYYIGASDMRLHLFENLFPINEGVSYNSYCIIDSKTCVLDTVDHAVEEAFFSNLNCALNGRKLDYLIVNHLEPDHSSCIQEVILRYPDVTVVFNEKSYAMFQKFIDQPITFATHIVKENDILDLGHHKLTFLMAPMVHWPEVMVTYDMTDKILFSADAFGTFGALQGNIFADEVNLNDTFYAEARRYYTNIVGKFGPAVQAILKKAQAVEVEMICPLHGPIWRKNLKDFIHRYDLWSRYEAEDQDIIIIYGSMYNNTYHVCEDLALLLADRGVKNIKLYDVSKVDISYLIAEIFRVKNIVLAFPNYNGGIYPKMHDLLNDMQALNVSNKNVAIIENGTWALIAGKKVRELLLSMKNIEIIFEPVRIETTEKKANLEQLIGLADLLAHL